ncbi:MAG: elongation factor P-like protein YeiP, partial [Pseudomonadota bacterium]|nr:elongation factor P-like protein YeiP [Pseudomonadota bacterium]
MPKASELKKGMIVEIDGFPHIVKTLEAKSPSSRGASTLYKVRFYNLKTGQKLDSSFKGEVILKEADCSRIAVQYSYRDGEIHYFMDMEDFTQHGMEAGQIDEQIPYLVEQQEDIIALIVDGNLVAVELPQSVNLEIIDTPPAVTGSSATNRSKTAILSTGLEI